MALNRQPQWNIYEAVVLLDGFLEAQRKDRLRSHIIKDVSAALRQMAVNQGLIIDDVYRNENGISYQLQSMESAIRGKKIYVPATKLFTEVVSIYNENRSRFDSLLEEARGMIELHNNKEAFLGWASSVVPEKQYKWLNDNLLHVEQYARAKDLIADSIYSVSDLSTLLNIKMAISKNKIFQIKYRKILHNIYDAFDVYIRYCTQLNPKTEVTSPAKEKTALSKSDSVVEINADNTVDGEASGIQRILVEHYQYGFRYDSIREIRPSGRSPAPHPPQPCDPADKHSRFGADPSHIAAPFDQVGLPGFDSAPESFPPLITSSII